MSKASNQVGATMVEFSLAIGIFFALIGAIVDFGIGFERWNRLHYVTATVVREFIATLNGRAGEPCGNLEAEIRERAIELLDSRYRLHLAPGAANSSLRDVENRDADYQVTAELVPPPPPMEGEPADSVTLRVTSELKIRCFFCMLLPKDLVISSSSEARVEDDNFRCW